MINGSFIDTSTIFLLIESIFATLGRSIPICPWYVFDMPPHKHVKPVRADGLQKLLLYLILLNFWLLYLYVAHFVWLPLTHALLVSLLCIGYNLLLCHLAVHRARRSTDGYIIYPVLLSALMFCSCILYFFVIR